MLADSPWVQAVAKRQGGGEDNRVALERLNAHAAQIAYTPLWTDLFDTLIKVTTEGLPPQAMLNRVTDASRGEEIAMFRAWFLEMWRSNEQQWGPVPA